MAPIASPPAATPHFSFKPASFALPIFLLLLAPTLSFASVLWVGDVNSTVVTEPFLSGGYVVMGTENGHVVGVLLASGRIAWDLDLSDRVEDVIPFQNDLLASTRDGRIVRINNIGRIIWTANLSALHLANTTYGLTTDGSQAFVSTDAGVFRVLPGGNLSLFYGYNGTATRPVFSGDLLVLGIEKELYVFRPSERLLLWRRFVGPFWSAAPAVAQNTVVVGTLDNRIRAFGLLDGAKLWEVETGGWITSTPLIAQGHAHAVSQDGGAYIIDLNDGSVIAVGRTSKALQAKPQEGSLQGRSVLFTGSQDRHAYAFDMQTGQVLWSWEAMDWVTHTLPMEGNLFVAARDGSLYLYQLDQACTVSSPSDGTRVGTKDIHLRGFAFPAGATVQVKVNDGQWLSVGAGGDWDYYLSAELLRPGSNLVFCQIAGAPSNEAFLLNIIQDKSVPPGRMAVNFSSVVNVGEDIPLTIYDSETGEPVPGVSIVPTVGASAILSDENGQANLRFGEPASYNILLQKRGFDDTLISITVVKPGDLSNLILPVVVILVVLAALGFAVKKFFFKPKPPPEFVP